MKFTLEIELGDDAMRRYDEIVRAIDYAPFHSQRLGFNLAQVGDGGILRDGNGKTVGKWAVTPSIGIEVAAGGDLRESAKYARRRLYARDETNECPHGIGYDEDCDCCIESF